MSFGVGKFLVVESTEKGQLYFRIIHDLIFFEVKEVVSRFESIANRLPRRNSCVVPMLAF